MTKRRISHRRFQRKSIGARARFNILERDGFRCRYCGATAAEERLHVDHISPVALGGDNDPENLATACSPCNLGKSDREIETDDDRFCQQIYRLIWKFTRWPPSERDPSILRIVRLASNGYSIDDLMEVGRVSKDASDVIVLCDWLEQSWDEE